MNSALVISAGDNVATALEALDAGATIRVGEVTVAVVDRIPRGHKIAIRAIPAGTTVVKYGSAIGTASTDIPVGAHVHVHNVASGRGRGDLSGPASHAAPPADPIR
ncbi:MAG TPA: UxaA family hydrolase [Vicinamibacterales bacterium]|nr:UxaA family hydrolase [Vicinamibacterales bacterium]